MDKEIVYLMCENLKEQSDEIDKMAVFDREKAVRFIHGQYEEAQREYNRRQAQIQSEYP